MSAVQRELFVASVNFTEWAFTNVTKFRDEVQKGPYGCGEMTLYKIGAELAYAGIVLASIIETVVRGFFGLLAQGINFLIPEGNVKDFFEKYILPLTWESAKLSIGFGAGSAVALVTNFENRTSQEIAKDWPCMQSLSEALVPSPGSRTFDACAREMGLF